jgi:hypothetical protein
MAAEAHPPSDSHREPHRGRPRSPRRLWPAGLLAVAVLSMVSLAAPEPARAIPVNPIAAIGDVLGAGANAITGGIGKVAVEAFEAIIKALFAWPAKIINRELLSWLVAVPDYAIHPESAAAGRGGSNLAELGATTSAMAFAALGAVATVSGIRYWAAGLSGSGGLEALEGLGRTVGAALFIVLWPWLFRHCADLANAAGSGLLGSGSVIDDTARLLAVAFAAAVAFNILSILIAIGAALLFLALLLTKIAVSAAIAVVFVAMPLAVMLWPIPELAWIARTAMRAFATVLVIPLAWAVCFATFAAVGIDALTLKGAGKVVDALIMPLVAVALLWLTVALPKTLARMALFGAVGGGGFLVRTASYLVARRADAALSQLVPAALGGNRASASHGVPMEQPAAVGGRRPSGKGPEAVTAGARKQPAGGAPNPAAAAVTAAAASGDAGSASSAAAETGGWTPPKGFDPATGQQPVPAARGGLRSPSWQEIKDHVPVELAAAAARQQSTTRADVAAAMRALPSDAQGGVVGLMDTKGGQIRGQMAHQAARGDLSDQERDAFRTLAAATPEVRAQGISDFLDGGADERPAAPSVANGATERTPAPDGSGTPPRGGSATPPIADGGFGPPPLRGRGGNGGSRGGDSFGSAADTPDPPPTAPLAGGGPMGPAPQPTPPPDRHSPSPSDDGSSTPPRRGNDDRLSD